MALDTVQVKGEALGYMVHPALENCKSNDTQIIVNFADFIDCLGSQEEKE